MSVCAIILCASGEISELFNSIELVWFVVYSFMVSHALAHRPEQTWGCGVTFAESSDVRTPYLSGHWVGVRQAT